MAPGERVVASAPGVQSLTVGSGSSQGPAGATGLMSAARAASEHQLCLLLTHLCSSGARELVVGGGTNSTSMQEMSMTKRCVKGECCLLSQGS